MTIDARILRGAQASVRRRTLPIAAVHGSHEARSSLPASDAPSKSPSTAVPAELHERASDAAASETAKAEAYAVGFREGHAEASRRCNEQLKLDQQRVREEAERLQRQLSERAQHEAQLMADLQRSVAQAVAHRLDTLEPQAIELAFTALCKVLGPETDRASLLSGLIRQAMAQMRSAKPVTIRLHPASLALIESRRTKLTDEAGSTDIEWIADASLPPAGCTLVGDQGQLDASLQTQLDSLRALWSAADPGAPS